MRLDFRMGLASAAVMLPLSAWAGTPAVEADRCTRYLAALVQGDAMAAVNVGLEHFKPGETPDRYVKTRLAANKVVIGNIEKRGGIKTVEALPDYIIQATGDIIRQEKWTDGKGAVSYVACVSFPGKNDPWSMATLFGGNDLSNLTSLSKAVEDDEQPPSWEQMKPLQ